MPAETLYLLTDGNCRFCQRAATWLTKQRTFVPLVILPTQSAEAKARFPDLEHPEHPPELVVVDGRGALYQDTSAWLMTLWALCEYRSWALRFATPSLAPMAKQLFALASSGRHLASALLRSSKDSQLRSLVQDSVPPEELECGTQRCDVRPLLRCYSCGARYPVGREFCPSCLAESLGTGSTRARSPRA